MRLFGRPLILAVFVVAFLVLFVTLPIASATAVPVGVGAFGPGSTLTTFTGLSNFTEVNGLTVDGIQFSYSGFAIIDGGPGTTNNIAPPNIVSGGTTTGTLSLLLPSSVSAFGYGFAILTTGAVLNATTLVLFQGATNVGTLSFAGALDPTFAGGFAGVQSTLPFNRVDLTFNSAAPSFALDNIRTATAVATPEPASLLLLGIGSAALLCYRRKPDSRRESQ